MKVRCVSAHFTCSSVLSFSVVFWWNFFISYGLFGALWQKSWSKKVNRSDPTELQVKWAETRLTWLQCRTTKRRHLAVFSIRLHWQRGNTQKKEENIISKNFPLHSSILHWSNQIYLMQVGKYSGVSSLDVIITRLSGLIDAKYHRFLLILELLLFKICLQSISARFQCCQTAV